MNIEILVATAIQLTLGGLLFTKMLSLPNCIKFKHRLISFVFAALGSVTITSGIFYYPEFTWLRSISLTLLSLTCILLLTSQSWNIPKVCYKLQTFLKGTY